MRLWRLGIDKSFYPALYNGCSYLSKLGLTLLYVSKRGPVELIFYALYTCRM